jgi:hypothetical protein
LHIWWLEPPPSMNKVEFKLSNGCIHLGINYLVSNEVKWNE